MKEFPCFNWGKSVFLLLNGYKPTRTATVPGNNGEPKLVCYFKGRDVGRTARTFTDLHSYGLDEQSAGRTPTPDELEERVNDILDEFEADGAKLDAKEVGS